jgi:hypothetical protein
MGGIAMSLRKVTPGEPVRLSAEMHNLSVQAIEHYQRMGRGFRDVPLHEFQQTGICLIRNDSGSDVGRFGVLGISGPLLTPEENLRSFQNIIAFKGITPSQASHEGKFCVTLEPIREGKIGRAVFSGVCVCKLNIEHDPTSSSSSMPEPGAGQYADVMDGSLTCLDSIDNGSARVLWHENEVGEVWALVHLGVSRRLGEIVGVQLTEDMGATTANEASCTVKETWDPESESFTGTGTGILVDPEAVFEGAVSGATGYARRMQGNGRIVYLGENLNCGTAASSSSSSSSSGEA